MKHYIIPEASLVRLQTSDVIASSVFVGVYDGNQNSYDFWDLKEGVFGESYSVDPAKNDWQ